MQGASSVAVGGMADIAVASDAGGSDQKGLDADIGPLTGDGPRAPQLDSERPRRLRPIKGLQWQTLVRGDIGRQRLFAPVANRPRSITDIDADGDEAGSGVRSPDAVMGDRPEL